MSTRPLTPGQLARVAEFYARQMTDKGHAVESSLVLRMAAINDAWRVAFATVAEEHEGDGFEPHTFPVLHVPTVTADPFQLDAEQYRTSLLEMLRRVKVLCASAPPFTSKDLYARVDAKALADLKELLP